MASSAVRLKLVSDRLQDRLRSLEAQKVNLIDKSNPLVRGIANWVSGADRFGDTFSDAYSQGRSCLTQARQALEKGQTTQAEQYLRNADRFLDRAELFWQGYVRTTRGAEPIV